MDLKQNNKEKHKKTIKRSNQKNKKKTKTQKKINKENHQKNGNIQKKYIMATWNKGNSLLKNSIQILQKALEEQKIDICGVQELNLRKSDDINTLKIPGYKIITDNLMNITDLARSAIIIKKDIKFRHRPDLSSQQESHTVITVHVTKKNKFQCTCLV